MSTSLSLEAVDFQDGHMFDELTKAFDQLRQDGSFTTESIKKCEFAEIVKLYTGMSIILHVEDKSMYSACIGWPQIDRNHPFVTELHRAYADSSTGLQLIRSLGTSVKGFVNRRSGMVGGIYREITGDIYFSAGLIKSRAMTTAELAAIMIHELGHLYTYFEYLGSVVMTSHVISAAAKACMEIEDVGERQKVLKEAVQILGIEPIDEDSLVRMNQKARGKATESVLIAGYAIKTRSDTGSSVYELRSAEQLADQFAARHGAGRDLATGLEKIMRVYWFSSTVWTSTHVLIEMVKLTFFTFALTLMPVSTVVFLLVTNPVKKIYDEPKDRIHYLKQMVIEELKTEGLTKERRESIAADIQAIEEVEGKLDDKRGLLEIFWNWIIPVGRAAVAQQKAQKEIEELMTNDLFAKANQFRIGV